MVCGRRVTPPAHIQAGFISKSVKGEEETAKGGFMEKRLITVQLKDEKAD